MCTWEYALTFTNLLAAHSRPNSYFKRTAPTPGTFGDIGRNAVIGPPLKNLNMQLKKTFRITERFKLDFSANASNALNHPSFALPDATIGPGHIGKITAVSVSSRNIELIAKLRF